jgi:hypothetical protein
MSTETTLATLLVCLGATVAAAGAGAADLTAPPAAAVAAGFVTATFDSRFDASTVDVDDTGRPGYLWYPFAMHGVRTDRRSIELADDGSVTLRGGAEPSNAQLMTITRGPGSTGPIGRTFSSGGYFEAVLKFDPKSVIAARFHGWPAFWAKAAAATFDRHSGPEDQWVGQAPSYRHNVEVDVFEFTEGVARASSPRYGVALHDWYGIFEKTCPKMCQVQVPIVTRSLPEDTDFSHYHAYGFLWIPAGDDHPGRAEFYFDRMLVGRSRSWTKFDPAVDVPPPSGDRVYAFLDMQHMALILGTGSDQPMTVASVRVWQRTASGRGADPVGATNGRD